MEMLTYIVHKRSMVDTSFTYRLCLEIVRKGVLLKVASSMGLIVARTATKAVMASQIEAYVQSHPKEVLGLLGVKELELVKEFVKAGPNTAVVKAPRKTLDGIKSLLLVSVYYDKRTRKENLLMADELRELFAPYVNAVLKEAKKKEREMVDDDSEKLPDYLERIRQRKENWKDCVDEFGDEGIGECEEAFDDWDEKWDDDDIEDAEVLNDEEEVTRVKPPHLVSKYSASYELVDDVRKLDYTVKPRVFKLFYRLLIADDYWSHSLFSRRFFESFRHIHYVRDEICTDDDSIEWLHYAENDFDNAISAIDYSDPMTFFDIAEKLDSLMLKIKGEKP